METPAFFVRGSSVPSIVSRSLAFDCQNVTERSVSMISFWYVVRFDGDTLRTSNYIRGLFSVSLSLLSTLRLRSRSTRAHTHTRTRPHTRFSLLSARREVKGYNSLLLAPPPSPCQPVPFLFLEYARYEAVLSVCTNDLERISFSSIVREHGRIFV